MNPLLNDAAITRFLNEFSSKSRRRGKHCHQAGTVLQLRCLVTNTRYQAVVQGSIRYEVTYDYDAAAQKWAAQCSCSNDFDCKHAYAGMLAFQAAAARFSTPQANALAKAKVGRKAKTTSAAPGSPAPAARPPVKPPVPQPPASPIATALALAVQRPLTSEESESVRRVQNLYREARGGRSICAEDLRRFAPDLRDYSWAALQLWPEFPGDDLQFWLFIAWELRRRGLTVPPPLQPVTDFKGIQAALDTWERMKAVERWRSALAQTAQRDHTSHPVDFRLVVQPEKAQIQWRGEYQDKFKDLKQTDLRRFNEAYQANELEVEADAVPLWMALYNPYDVYTPCNLEYTRAETAKLIRHVVRAQQLAARVVTPEGVPLARPGEPLQYRLQSPTDDSGDYQLELALPDGTVAPRVLLALPGRPAFYLTVNALYEGPPPHGFDLRQPLRIPAPALETTSGVAFLDRLTLSLPPRLQARIRRIPARVRLNCELKAIYQGSDTQAVFIRVLADLAGGPSEAFCSWGWDVPGFSGRGNNARSELSQDGTIPMVDRSTQQHFPRVLEALEAKWDDYQARWRVRLTKSFPETFVSWLQALPPGIEVHLDPELATLRSAPISGTVQLDVEEAGVDWFDLKVVLNVSDTQLTPDELKLLLNARGRFVRLENKGWRRLQFDFSPEDDERLARLGLNARDFTAEPQRLHALQLADDAARKFLPEAQAEAIQRRASELKTRVTPPVPGEIRAQLRPYQQEGFHFLAYLTANRFGGVLADDMGLGKTLQTLTWLEWLRQGPDSNGHAGVSEAAVEDDSAAAEVPSQAASPLPSLVVCPKSVMDNWRAEAERFCSGLRVRLWRGEEAKVLASARAEADLLVINYAQLRSLSPEIAQHRWQAAILDEAQSIKNPDSQTAQAARALQAEHRLALTGTPIENRLLDLWSIFAFAMPGVLGNRAQFGRRFNQQDDPFARRRLAARVRPFLLRRTKGQVAQDLPDRVEEDLVCEMEGEQKLLYRAEFKRAQQLLLSVSTQQELNEQRFNFLTSLLRLRQICCHPALVSEDLQKVESAKVTALLDLLEPLMEGGHKVLVFSQFVTMLDILQGEVRSRAWTDFYLAGDTENRGELVNAFQKAPGAGVFLISLKAGGFGLNLTAASYVVLFDPWWNPAVEMQAIDRTHRIGQTSKVMAYRLLMKDSIEQKIRQLQRTKAALAEDVLGEEKFSQSLTLDDLRFLFAEDDSA